MPTTGTHTTGNNNSIYLGYGAGSTKLTVTPSGAGSNGNNFTYSWSPSANLTGANTATPVFTPTAGGNYTFTATVTNSNGCTTTCSITICVLDIRVPGQSGKVYLCHVPQGNPSNVQTLSISTNAVPAHLGHTGDHLGACDQLCGSGARMSAGSRNELDEEVIVYPNPNNGAFTVKLPYIEDKAIVTITDVAGKVVENRIVRDGDANKQSFDLNNIARGMYFVEVANGEHRFRTRLIIQ
jgi:PKD repeat protein